MHDLRSDGRRAAQELDRQMTLLTQLSASRVIERVSWLTLMTTNSAGALIARPTRRKMRVATPPGTDTKLCETCRKNALSASRDANASRPVCSSKNVRAVRSTCESKLSV